MGSDRNGKEEGVVGKWKKGEQMIDGQSGVWRGRNTAAARIFRTARLPNTNSHSAVVHQPPAADPSCHLMPPEHGINRHSWYKQA